MSRPTFINSTVVYNDHSTEYNIDARGTKDIASVIRACEAEDIETEREKPRMQSISLPFLVPEKLSELGIYTLEEFDDMYHDKVKNGAPELAEFLKHYSELQVLNLGKYKKKAIYNKLKSFFGDEMDFGYPNFAAYY